jgi:hypothetical protein
LIRQLQGVVVSRPFREERGMDGAPNDQYSIAGSIEPEKNVYATNPARMGE